MVLIARVIGWSVLTGVLGAALGQAFFRPPDASIISLALACAGAIIGGLAAAAHEIVTALRERPRG